ncbi:hypothetical protein OHC33_003538 [Knufia fluminis]|uniref:NmrA-like domain-containing protein n=1 Tax=Knufia fluminis TaxID=191047 RepID=A0AAN8I9R7_9EURO|nr:hypothetical protein OHC33_003538 [Knufia fluminis]
MAVSTKLIAVVGATGTQGGSVVDTFAVDPLWRIKAITRNTSSAKAQALLSKHPDTNIDLVAADLSDVSSLVKAFEGATAIFGVTNFWTLYGDEKIQARAADEGRSANELCFELELQQGKNIFDAAAQTQGLERLIFSEAPNVSKISDGKYKYVLHFDSKAFAVEYGQQRYPELWARTSLVRLGTYLENFLNQPYLLPEKNEEGVFVFVAPGTKETLLPLVVGGVETGTISKVLVDVPAGKHVIAYRELIKLETFVEAWSNFLGVTATIDYGGIAAKLAQMPISVELKKEILEMFNFLGEFGYIGDDETVIHPKDIGVVSGSVEEWIRERDWCGVVDA